MVARVQIEVKTLGLIDVSSWKNEAIYPLQLPKGVFTIAPN